MTLQTGQPVEIRCPLTRGTVYAVINDTQIAVRHATVPSSIGIFNAADVFPAPLLGDQEAAA